MKKVVIGMGEALWDCLPTGKKMGGAPANFAYHVSQFGMESYAVSAVGDDELGNELLGCYDKAGLSAVIEKVAFPTGTVKVTVDEKGIPSYDICEGVAWDNIEFTQELRDLAKRTDVVCFGSLAQRNAVSRKTINDFIDAMPAGSQKVFDINLRQSFYSKEIIENSMKKSTILKINDEELVIVKDLLGLSGSEKEVCLALLANYSLEMVILTCGTDGSKVFTATEESVMPTPKVDVVDTVGAGDSFTGAFIAAYISGKSIKEAHSLAVEVSAYVCTKAGAMPELPAELKSRL